jgi:RNA recognition motif-containing protein
MGSRLFVGNLPYSCTEQDLREVFQARWAIMDVRIVTDRDTGRSKGFGFVELETEAATRHAIEVLDGSEVFGRRLAVREAHERPGGGAKPKRGRVESKPEVATVLRRGSARPGLRAMPESDGRRWQAPAEPDGLGEWAAEEPPSRK